MRVCLLTVFAPGGDMADPSRQLLRRAVSQQNINNQHAGATSTKVTVTVGCARPAIMPTMIITTMPT